MFIVGMSTNLCICKCNLDMNRTFNYITIPEGFNEKFLEHLEKIVYHYLLKYFWIMYVIIPATFPNS